MSRQPEMIKKKMIDANKTIAPHEKKHAFAMSLGHLGTSHCVSPGRERGGFFLSGDPLVLRGKRGGSVVANNGRGKEGGGRVIKNITEP